MVLEVWSSSILRRRGIRFRKAKENIIITTFFQVSGNSTYLVLKKKIISPKKLLRYVFVESQLVLGWPFCKHFFPVKPQITLSIIIKKRSEWGRG